MPRALLVLLLLGCGSPPATDAGAPDAGPPPEPAPSLLAAAVSLDITPEPGIEIVGFGNRTSTEVRDPLEAAVLLLERDRLRLGVVTLDLPGITDGHATTLRLRLSTALGVPFEHVIVVASHSHSAPMLTADDWSVQTMDRLVAAAEALPDALSPATLGYGESEVGFNVNRRRVVDGEAVYAPDFEGPHDTRVRVLRVRASEGPLLATVVHAVSHPNILRGPVSPLISADFVGAARAAREDDAPWLFLQGAAGDIRPDIVDEAREAFREGTGEDIDRVGAELAAAVAAAPEDPVEGPFGASRRPVELELSRGGWGTLELSAFRLGDLVLLTLPGEPMVEIGLHVEQALVDELGPSRVPVVLGYTNGYADYIVTEEARMYGGYEVRRSDLVPSATGQLEAALYEMGVALYE